MGRYEDAESSIRLYIAHLENNQGDVHEDNNADILTKQSLQPQQKQQQPQDRDDRMHELDTNLEQHLAVAYTLLSTIIGLSSDGRSVEARQNDVRAGNLLLFPPPTRTHKVTFLKLTFDLLNSNPFVFQLTYLHPLLFQACLWRHIVLRPLETPKKNHHH